MSQCSNRGPQIIKQLRNDTRQQYPNRNGGGQISKSINFEDSRLEFNTSAIITNFPNQNKMMKGAFETYDPTAALENSKEHNGLSSAN